MREIYPLLVCFFLEGSLCIYILLLSYLLHQGYLEFLNDEI